MPTSSSQIPIFTFCPPAHITEHELRQFLLFSMPQCRSNAVVVRTTPSPSPDLAAQFSRSGPHMHRNMARLARYTPSTPPHTAGTAAAG